MDRWSILELVFRVLVGFCAFLCSAALSIGIAFVLFGPVSAFPFFPYLAMCIAITSLGTCLIMAAFDRAWIWFFGKNHG